MKHQVTQFKSLTLALKELQPFIRDGEHLQTGKPFKRFGGLRSRELLANWLLCVTANYAAGSDRLTFTSDPTGSDGIIRDRQTEETWRTEHVLVPKARGEEKPIDVRILKAIALKQNKGGAAYASGKTLVVMLNADGGPWYPNKVADQLPAPLDFDAVWVVGLHGVDADEYVYDVVRLDRSRGNAPAWSVRIAKGFESWTIKPVQ